jgi:hypothetical protein
MNMRYMVIVKANERSEAGELPSEQELVAMGKYNDQLIKAGIMLAGEGLQSSAEGKRVKFEGGKRTVTDGPFAETKELIAGFWILQVKSEEELLEWVRRAPFTKGEEVEIRKVFEAEDFADAVKTDAGAEVLAKEEEFRKQHGQK